MALCAVHTYVKVADKPGSVCSRCKACKHESVWRTAETGPYRCAGCYMEWPARPAGARASVLVGREWREER